VRVGKATQPIVRLEQGAGSAQRARSAAEENRKQLLAGERRGAEEGKAGRGSGVHLIAWAKPDRSRAHER